MHSIKENIKDAALSDKKEIPPSVVTGYSLKIFDAGSAEAWDDFVEKKSINGNFLHTRKFYHHNPQNAIDDRSYLFYKKNKLIGLLGAALLYRNGIPTLFSHPRATYGGFIVSKDVGIEASLAMVHLMVEEAKKTGIQEIIIRNPFRIFFKKPCDEFDYALWYHGFTVRHRELEIAIPLRKDKDPATHYTEGARSGLHKAQKILTVEQSEDYRSFWKLLEKNLEEKHKKKPTHSYAEFCNLLACVGPEKIKLFASKKENRMVAGLVLFLLNDRCVHAQYIAYDSAFQNDRPLNLLIHEVACWARERGYRYFNLGTANEQQGEIINYSLFRFKESYGGRGVLRETLHLKFE